VGSALAVLAQIYFRDGMKVPYDVPRNDLDPRVVLCADHRPACDCREGQHAEQIRELQQEAHGAELAEETLTAIARLHSPRRPRYRNSVYERCAVCLGAWPCPTRVLAESNLSPWQRVQLDQQDVAQEVEHLKHELRQANARVANAAEVLRNEARLPTGRVATALEYLDPSPLEVPF
jgi:hypothetical protein